MQFSDDEGEGASHHHTTDYSIWLNEPISVSERRRRFYARINGVPCGTERAALCSDAVSSSPTVGSFLPRESHTSGSNEMSVADDPQNSTEEVHRPELISRNEGLTEKKKAKIGWWKYIVESMKDRKGKSNTHKKGISRRAKVKHIKKKKAELTAMYTEQEFRAHNGTVWAMSFSSDGKYLATGGEDGVVRIWRVTLRDASSNSGFRYGVLPRNVFRMEESPAYELRGHTGDVLDLGWSTSNFLLSSSTDGTARLWKLGSTACVNVFRHSNYVTCVQFNPVDDNIFVTGSVDGHVRVWGVSEKRVIDWAVAKDVITSICYQPDGNGVIVGCLTGTCRFYHCDAASNLEMQAELRIQGRRRSGSRVTGIQFMQGRSRRVVISCQDSKLRVFEGMDLVQKFRGLPNSGSQMSPSFTATGNHVLSIGEDSRVYLWNHDELLRPSQTKSVRACESFTSPGVSVAVPWCGWGEGSLQFPLGEWATDGRCKGSTATWPEEKLSMWRSRVASAIADADCVPPHAWGLVIITAGWDGTIRTYHNYGLPTKID